jgi:hypothetical protein
MQTEVKAGLGLGQEGQTASTDGITDSRRNSALVKVGRLVVVASGGGCAVPAAAWTEGQVLGVSRLLYTNYDVDYPASGVVTYLSRGSLFVLLELDATAVDGGQVFVRHTANGANKLELGAFRHDADGGNAALVHGMYYRSSASGDGLAIVEIR